ncbi:acyl-coa binding protein [Angomonas deanei]|uniref:Acyl CoA binding protein, putative n=1 Tax=Angomonas deanei TaxID=59799 RepID=A0A7G2C4Y4_9TRYP|nr:acyl-coa binding protein [Angomonas deanei]CAD2214555.1 Acyl CoA binding protein, putative [Angomonas deanei]|eukprot:EPY40354.1 acyl-coa binding protein [Angomonas deanei]
MTSLNEEFAKFEKSMATIRSKLSIPQKIEMYGLWCVATRGKCDRPQPSRARLLEYGKFKAWKKYEHLTQDEAKKKFIERAKSILPSKL